MYVEKWLMSGTFDRMQDCGDFLEGGAINSRKLRVMPQ